MTGTTDSLADPIAYRDAVVALVGGRNPRAILGELLDAVRAEIAALPAERHGVPEAPGRWSLRQVVQHLADVELAYGWRVRLVLTADRPPLHGFDENAWMRRLRADDADLEAPLAMLGALRQDLLRLIDSCTPADLARVGVHSERGEESLELLLQVFAGHDLVHRRQLARIRAAVG
jgi:uncharacterized damage-inducible protein DinB